MALLIGIEYRLKMGGSLIYDNWQKATQGPNLQIRTNPAMTKQLDFRLTKITQ